MMETAVVSESSALSVYKAAEPKRMAIFVRWDDHLPGLHTRVMLKHVLCHPGRTPVNCDSSLLSDACKESLPLKSVRADLELHAVFDCCQGKPVGCV